MALMPQRRYKWAVTAATGPLGAVLREATDADLEALFVHQADPSVKAMADHPGREREAFFVHMRTKVLGQPNSILQIIDVGGVVTGNVVSWLHEGQWNLGYVLGPAWWGKGLASWAVERFLGTMRKRPLFADVARHNVGSQRVLEKNGFVRVGEHSNGIDYRLE